MKRSVSLFPKWEAADCAKKLSKEDSQLHGRKSIVFAMNLHHRLAAFSFETGQEGFLCLSRYLDSLIPNDDGISIR